MNTRSRDLHRVVDAIQDLGMGKDIPDLDAFRERPGPPSFRYYGQSLGDIELGSALNEAFDLARRYRLKIPINLANLMKALLVAEGIGSHLDPEFNIDQPLFPAAT